MRIKNLRIKNFRTITQDQTITLQNGVTLVGPNNSGKTNALLGIYLFFTGHENKYGYDPERDLPFSSKNTQTSLTCFFEADPETDKDILAKLQKLRQMLKSSRDEATPTQFSISPYPYIKYTPEQKKLMGNRLNIPPFKKAL